MRSKIITITIFLSSILPIIYAECYIRGPYIIINHEEVRNLECYNTSIDNYIQDLNDLLVSDEQKRDFPIPKLQQLTIINSNFSHIEYLLNPIPIILRYNLEKDIKQLAVKSSKIKFIKPEAFNDFDKLINLNLGFNSIEDISFISNLPASLMYLNLTNNRIKNIDFDLFSHIIDCLDLSFNEITYLSITSRTYFNAPYFPISKCLYLNNNYIHKIQYNFVIILDSLQVNLGYNDINTIKFNKSGYIEINLRLLDLSHQSSKPNLNIFFTNKLNFAFEKLILADNEIEHLTENITSFSNYYRSGDFSNCSLTTINNFNLHHSYTNSVNFSYNNLKTINESTFAECSIETVDLSFNQIDDVNLVFENALISKLNLSSNKISELSSFGFASLEWLDLSFNNLKLNNYSFANCLGLTTLNLSSSNISQIEDLAFMNLSSLTYLNLNNNSIQYLNANIFKPLKAIEEISLNNNQLTIIDEYVFSFLPLNSLNINENRIGSIQPNAFYNLSNIQIINMNYNNEKLSIEIEAFSNLPLLREVYLKHSNIHEITSDIFSNVPKLAILDIRDNNITTLNFSNKYSSNIKLKELYITFRGTIETKSFENLMFLETLKFSNSEINSINEKAFQGLFNLRNLEFENTKIQSLNFGALDGLFAANNVDLKHVLEGRHILIGNMFRNFYSIRSFNLSNMQLENVVPHAFEGLKRLYELDLSNNQIKKIQMCTFCGLKNLSVLDLSNNKIEKIPKCTFCGLDSLYKLDLSNNTLVTLKYGYFNGLKNLRELNLNSNAITDIELGALQNFPFLQELSLAENNLTEFKVGIFSNFLSLETLDLQKNSISTLLFESFLPLKSLKYLSLEFNNLKSIGHFSMVSSLSLLRRFNINKNKWKCDYLANMLVTFKKHYIDYSSSHLNFLNNNIEGIECIDICAFLLCLKDSHGIN
ncbi:unnamed protein product [Ceutorhynchus assimilis]|uniref:Uncharacterized protein n=1 Tax=Ceutorhynchus assimilis TaxID=467358 RepID=A0A9N9N1S8_9CUCU|nr:unnamed protein product [Ceutorhynchus assimilis]